jgi:hypothetical protein
MGGFLAKEEHDLGCYAELVTSKNKMFDMELVYVSLFGKNRCN